MLVCVLDNKVVNISCLQNGSYEVVYLENLHNDVKLLFHVDIDTDKRSFIWATITNDENQSSWINYCSTSKFESREIHPTGQDILHIGLIPSEARIYRLVYEDHIITNSLREDDLITAKYRFREDDKFQRIMYLPDMNYDGVVLSNNNMIRVGTGPLNETKLDTWMIDSEVSGLYYVLSCSGDLSVINPYKFLDSEDGIIERGICKLCSTGLRYVHEDLRIKNILINLYYIKQNNFHRILLKFSTEKKIVTVKNREHIASSVTNIHIPLSSKEIYYASQGVLFGMKEGNIRNPVALLNYSTIIFPSTSAYDVNYVNRSRGKMKNPLTRI